MKRVFAILLVALLVAGTVFAGTVTSTIRIKSKVGNTSISDANITAGSNPSNIYGVLYALTFNDDTSTTKDTDDIRFQLSSMDISKENVTGYFRVLQTELTKTNEQINLSVTAPALSFFDGSQTYSSDAPTLSGWVTGGDIANLPLTVTGTTSANTAAINLNYTEFQDVPAGTLIGTFTGTWAQKASLSSHPGLYKADLTMTYTVN